MTKAREIAELGQKLTVDASGNLDIAGNITSDELDVTSTGVQGIHLRQQGDNTNNSSRLFFDNSTNIWTAYSTLGEFKLASGATVGTSSGTDRLVIESDGDFRFGSAANYAWMRPYEASTGNLIISADNGGTGTNGSAIKFRTRGADKMIIEHGGSVGINTTSPNVHGWTKAVSLDSTGAGSSAAFELNKNGVKYGAFDVQGDGRVQILNHQNYPITFNTNGSERVRISNEGNVGIGTNSPNQLLTLGSSTANATIGLDFETSNTIRGSILYDANAGELALTSGYSGYGGRIVFEANGSEVMRVTNNNTVGIGTTSPSSGLHVRGTGSHSWITVENTQANNYSIVDFKNESNERVAYVGTYNGGNALYLYGAKNGPMQFFTNSVERMRLDTNGSLIVGGTADGTASSITLQGDGDIRGVLSSGAGGDSLISAISGVSNGYQIVVDSSNNQTYKWHNGGTQSMTLDSSGNFLVGHTAESTWASNNGATLRGTGVSTFTSTSTPPLYANRLTSDGDIVEFRKDGSQIGTIGVDNTDNLTVAGNANHAGLMFGTDGVLPYKNGALRNGTEDLGSAAHRWRDIIISGGIYLGGTTSPHKLDDYEEGTWTPTLTASTGNPTVTYTTQKGRYVKVGQMVTVAIDLRWSAQTGGSGNTFLAGFPFQNSDAYYGGQIFESGSSWNWGSGRTVLGFEIQQNNTQGSILVSSSNNGSASLNISNLGSGSGYVIFSFTYRAAT